MRYRRSQFNYMLCRKISFKVCIRNCHSSTFFSANTQRSRPIRIGYLHEIVVFITVCTVILYSPAFRLFFGDQCVVSVNFVDCKATLILEIKNLLNKMQYKS